MKLKSLIWKAYDRVAKKPVQGAVVFLALATITSYVYLWFLFESQGEPGSSLLTDTVLLNVASWLFGLALFLFAEAVIIGFLSAANRSLRVGWKSFIPAFVAFFAVGILSYNLSALLWLKLLVSQGMLGLAMNLFLSLLAMLTFPVFNVIQLKRAFRLPLWQAASVFLVSTAFFGFWFFLLSVALGSIFYAPVAGLTTP